MRRTVCLALLILTCASPLTAEEPTPRLSQERVVLRTSLRDIVIALYPDNAPRHVEKFLTMARMGLYDGTIIFLVYPDYVAQVYGIRYGNKPMSQAAEAIAKPLKSETSQIKHRRGTVAFAQDLKNEFSDESSFFIFLSDAAVLNGKATVLGEVRRGIEVVEAISRVKASSQKRMPLDPVIVDKIEIFPDESMLASAGLRGLTPRAEKEPFSLPMEYAGLVVLSLALALGTFLSAQRGAARNASAFALLTALSLFFLLYAGLAPQAAHSPWLGSVLFLAALSIFKLMTFFER